MSVKTRIVLPFVSCCILSSASATSAEPGACGGPVGDCCTANGTPGCEQIDCCEAVCETDPFCCDIAWDQVCADAAHANPNCVCGPATEACCFSDETCQDLPVMDCVFLGGTQQGEGTSCDLANCKIFDCGDPKSGDCFEANGSPACDNAACCEAVCSFDPFCCTTMWDLVCVQEALANPACEITCPGDLTNDGVVNAADLAVLLGAWGPCPGCPEDLNGDGDVNAADLAVLLGAWGSCPK